MLHRLGDFWLVFAGIVAALVATALVVALEVSASPWGVAGGLLLATLIGQLVISGRIALRRERRLVEVAAQLREAHARLEQLAAVDPLTGIANRRTFFDRYGSEFRRSVRYGRPLALLMIDLDRFKQTQDLHGHQFGDQVLEEVAGLLRASLRESDLVARYGGEEFVAMLPETGAVDAVTAAEKLRTAVEGHEFHAGAASDVAVRVTVSVGAAALDGATGSDEALLREADRALYAAKHGGRNRTVLASDLPAEAAAGAATPEAGRVDAGGVR